jgi:hypothetical protein
VEVEALPEPRLALPAPELTKTQQDAWDRGVNAARKGQHRSTNPYLYQSPEWFAWADGWKSTSTDAEEGEADDLEIGKRDEDGPMDLREDLSDRGAGEEE